jgi:FAD:protein FMN transferase
MPLAHRLFVPLIVFLCLLSRARRIDAAEYTFFHENVLGTSLELHVLADDLEKAQWAEARVLGEIDRLAQIFSGYDPASEFSRWQSDAGKPVPVSSALFEMLAACDRWHGLSGGAFDPRVEVLSRLWSTAAKRDRMPTPAELQRALSRLSRPAWRLDHTSRTAQRLSDCPLSLNAIAKGEIVERACAIATRPDRGVQGLLLNLGGDLRASGTMETTLGIASPWADAESNPPLAFVRVKDCAVATSGSSQRGFQIGSQWFSHILDPRTGMPAGLVASATVIASRSADADALATICNVLEPDESLRLVRSVPGAECLIIGSDRRIRRSDGWQRFDVPPQTMTALALESDASPSAKTDNAKDGNAPATTSWNKEFELLVNFEINRPDGEGRRYRRPYVAVWVENQEGFPVRNLLLWVSMGGAGPFQWLPDLKRWYRADQERKQVEKRDLFFTIARPTRQPGKYKVAWDGKDNHGKPVAPGEYTILIDAAREHGTYQSLRKKVTLADQPFKEELKGGVEIKGATIEYRRKGSAQP